MNLSLVIIYRCLTFKTRYSVEPRETVIDLFGNKIIDKMTGAASESSFKTIPRKTEDIKFDAPAQKLIEIRMEWHISPEKRQQIIEELRLI